jgi:ribosomal protein S18 acetylase RimI-like enzyme
MDINIRQAKLSDLDKINALQAKLIQFERRLDPTIKKGIKEYYDVSKLLKSKKVLFLVAEVKNKVVGCGFGQIKYAVEWVIDDKEGYIGLMFVSEKYRSKGIGGMIIDDLILWFNENKINSVSLKVYDNNINAIKSYQKKGFERFLVEMRSNI